MSLSSLMVLSLELETGRLLITLLHFLLLWYLILGSASIDLGALVVANCLQAQKTNTISLLMTRVPGDTTSTSFFICNITWSHDRFEVNWDELRFFHDTNSAIDPQAVDVVVPEIFFFSIMMQHQASSCIFDMGNCVVEVSVWGQRPRVATCQKMYQQMCIQNKFITTHG